MNYGINKLVTLLLLFTLLIGFTSCDSLKKLQPTDKPNQEAGTDSDELDEIQGKKVFNSETGEYEIVTDVTGDLDTIRWNEPTVNTPPPITSEATQNGTVDGVDENTVHLASYKVALAIPFLADKYDEVEQSIDRRSLPALNFYEGAKMAFDVLSGEGVNLEVNVLDTRASEGTTVQLTNNFDIQTSNLVIGTFRNSTAKVMAEFAKKNKVTFVSPIYPHQNLSTDNQYFIQLNPSERTHAEAVMQHVKSKFKPDNIVVFARDNGQEQRLMQYYSDAHFALEGSTSADSIQLVTISDESASFEETELLPYMDDIQTTAFIIASSSQSFVYAMLRKIDLEKEDRSIVVYGQPRWKDFTQIGYEYYETLNIHISSEAYLNPDSYDIESFKQGFFNKFGMPPTMEAYKGYDTVLFFGRMLHEHGTGFRNKLDQNPKDNLHTRFDIQRSVTQPIPVGTEGEALNKFDQYMNKYVNILEFSGYKFRKAD